MNAVERDFLALTNTETGTPAVERVVRFRDADVHGPEAHAELPDLFVLWRAHDRPIEAVRHGTGVRVTQRPDAKGLGGLHRAQTRTVQVRNVAAHPAHDRVDHWLRNG